MRKKFFSIHSNQQNATFHSNLFWLRDLNRTVIFHEQKNGIKFFCKPDVSIFDKNNEKYLRNRYLDKKLKIYGKINNSFHLHLKECRAHKMHLKFDIDLLIVCYLLHLGEQKKKSLCGILCLFSSDKTCIFIRNKQGKRIIIIYIYIKIIK